MSLYDKDNKYTEAAFALDERTQHALEKIFADSVKDGASPREISHIMISVIHGLELFHVL